MSDDIALQTITYPIFNAFLLDKSATSSIGLLTFPASPYPVPQPIRQNIGARLMYKGLELACKRYDSAYKRVDTDYGIWTCEYGLPYFTEGEIVNNVDHAAAWLEITRFSVMFNEIRHQFTEFLNRSNVGWTGQYPDRYWAYRHG